MHGIHWLMSSGMDLRHLFRPAASCLKRVPKCYFSTSSSSTDPADLPLPSSAFLKTHIRTSSQKEKLISRASEIQLFRELSSCRNITLDDSSWLAFLKLHSYEERGRYLLELTKFKDAPKTDTGEETRLISEINQERSDNGCMVYAPGFNEFWELKGQHFRAKIDGLFGSRLLAMERIEEQLPKLVVDCRFLREYSVTVQTAFAKQINSLHEANWSSRRPFDIRIANFAPDNQLADISKRSWIFRYGPPNAGEHFRPHSFSPSISARGVKEVAACDSDSIMYISWRANQFLPENPPPVKAVVLCASNDFQPWSSSISAAQKDNIKAYRIPVQKHIKLDGAKATLSLAQSAAVLSAYFSRKDIGPTLMKIFDGRRKTKSSTAKQEEEFVEKFKTICEQLEREKEREVKYQQWLKQPTERKPRTHKYSREERKKQRAVD